MAEIARRRTIAVVTGSRAEYGLLYWLLREIADDPTLELRLVVTGMHLAPQFGLTWRAIEEDGFPIAAKVEMLQAGDGAVATAQSLALGVIGMAAAFERLKPDIVVLLGDRFEILAAAEAAMIARLPIAHLYGGEITEGAIDDAMRHAITKMAHLHFVANQTYRRRVIQLGEAPERVFAVGAAGLDNIFRLDLLDLGSLEDAIGFRLGPGYLVLTYHPVTLGEDDGEPALGELLAALDAFPERRVLITGVNADPGRDRLARRLAAYAAVGPGRVLLVTSLGQRRYLSAVKHAAAVVGNSSSGILEAPALQVPSVNVGPRQQGRLRAPSVIDCGESRAEIVAAIGRAVAPEFRAGLGSQPALHGTPGAARRIAAVLREFPLDGILVKRFHDIAAGEGAAHGT